LTGAAPLRSRTARITWAGHATALLELGDVRLLTDPVLRPRVAHLRRGPDLPDPQLTRRLDAVLLSHLHMDHLDLPSLRSLDVERAIAPRGAARVLRRAGFATVTELVPGEGTEVDGLTVEATPAEHDSRRLPLGARAEPIGFVIRGERSVYFAGDTDLFPGMAELGPVDVALLPVAGWGPRLGPGHLNPERAARAAALLRPGLAVPIHWGTLYPRGRRRGPWFDRPAIEFANRVAELAPDVAVLVLAPGEYVDA
jgi:L-ascorbate metabolism protein UlaG (beta-lactamase superfamily)